MIHHDKAANNGTMNADTAEKNDSIDPTSSIVGLQSAWGPTPDEPSMGDGYGTHAAMQPKDTIETIPGAPVSLSPPWGATYGTNPVRETATQFAVSPPTSDSAVGVPPPWATSNGPPPMPGGNAAPSAMSPPTSSVAVDLQHPWGSTFGESLNATSPAAPLNQRSDSELFSTAQLFESLIFLREITKLAT
jgi:hypothetical protein